MKPTHRDSSDEDLSDLLDDELTDSSTEERHQPIPANFPSMTHRLVNGWTSS